MLFDLLSLNSLLKKNLLDSPLHVEVVFPGVVQIQDLSPKTLNPIDHDLFHPEAVHHHLKNQSLHLREKRAFLYFLNDLFTTLRQYFFKID